MNANGDPATHDARVLVTDPDGALYAVPVAVLATYQPLPARREELLATAQQAAAARSLPVPAVPPDQPVYELTPERLAPYRLAEEQRQAVAVWLQPATAQEEVHGYEDSGGGTPGPQYGPSTGSHAWYMAVYEVYPVWRMPPAQPISTWLSLSG
jgi:hypothetical protein